MPCKKLNSCPKITMILDKDISEFQYAEAIEKVCGKCKEREDDKAVNDA